MTTYFAHAAPQTPNSSGTRYFGTNQGGTIYQNITPRACHPDRRPGASLDADSVTVVRLGFEQVGRPSGLPFFACGPAGSRLTRHVPRTDNSCRPAGRAGRHSMTFPCNFKHLARCSHGTALAMYSCMALRRRGDSVFSARGFTLIELLIVCGILGVLAAMVTAYLLRAKLAANEASAIGTLRAVNSAQIAYSSSCGKNAFAPTFARLVAGVRIA